MVGASVAKLLSAVTQGNENYTGMLNYCGSDRKMKIALAYWIIMGQTAHGTDNSSKIVWVIDFY